MVKGFIDFSVLFFCPFTKTTDNKTIEIVRKTVLIELIIFVIIFELYGVCSLHP
jgi:hypothetical protein